MVKVNNPKTMQSVYKKFEAMLKQQSINDSGSKCLIITYEIAKKLGLEINKSLPNSEASARAHTIDKAVSGIVKQVLDKKIWISLYQLLEIAKRKKRFLNDTASETTSISESGSSSESSSDEDFTVDVAKAKKHN
ncbi:1720_t:CDS:2 [Cetraspora pellucida]|uniref:1720_t:CDS:1 n=1 Tax=Cetraspora pellucida TaxID=1433469 RepID=A0ACA9LZT2_9GLOM|nr:1720_t:CDS:2 [Cetraspora pellucida]